MRIEQRAPITQGAGVRPRAASGARFTPDAGGAAKSGGAGPVGGLIGLDAVLALQSEPEEAREQRRRAARRGHELLDSLEALKIALLSGRVSAQHIARLAQQTQEASALSGDPRIDELLAHIELRARVEVAKLGRR